MILSRSKADPWVIASTRRRWIVTWLHRLRVGVHRHVHAILAFLWSWSHVLFLIVFDEQTSTEELCHAPESIVIIQHYLVFEMALSLISGHNFGEGGSNLLALALFTLRLLAVFGCSCSYFGEIRSKLRFLPSIRISFITSS